jgi:hypothetical protein
LGAVVVNSKITDDAEVLAEFLRRFVRRLMGSA